MARKIHKTDSLSPPILVRELTTNATVHPTSSVLDSRSVEASSSIFIIGKGAPGYGEPIFENLVQMLEHHSGASVPVNPTSGQLWFARENYLRSSTGFWVWSDDIQDWTSINENALPYSFIDPLLYYTESSDPDHPLYNIAVQLQYKTDLSIATPSNVTHTPNHKLKLYNGIDWLNIASVKTNSTAPHVPEQGDLWYDTSASKIKIYDGANWRLPVEDYLPLSGGSLTGDLSMGANKVTSTYVPMNAEDLTNKAWVELYVTAGTSTINFDSLTDVIITGVNSGDLLSHNGTDWVNVSTIPSSNITGVTGPIQGQLDNKLNLTGGTLTGSLSMSSQKITSLDTTPFSDPPVLHEAANVEFVLDAIAGSIASPTPRNITITGDASWTVSFDGTSDVSSPLTLANSGVVAGTYKSVSVNSKGIVESGTNPTTLAGFGIVDAQPLDADLTAIAASSGSGLLRRTGVNTWALGSITLSGDVSGTGTTSLSTTVLTPQSGTWWNNGFPKVNSVDGVMEIGKHIDFHTTSGSVADYDSRISSISSGVLRLTAATDLQIYATGSNLYSGGFAYPGLTLVPSFGGGPAFNIIGFNKADTGTGVVSIYSGTGNAMCFDGVYLNDAGIGGTQYSFNRSTNIGSSTNYPILNVNYGEIDGDPDHSNRVWMFGLQGRNHVSNTYLYDDVALGTFAENFRVEELWSGNGSAFRMHWRTNGNVKLAVETNSNVYCDGAFIGGGADYAEMFEWSDGNPTQEDRIGRSVCLDGNTGKIKLAQQGDIPIGAISGNTSVIGNDPIEWHGKYLYDVFRRRQVETVDVVNWLYKGDPSQGIDAKNHCYDIDKIPLDVNVPEDASYSTVTRAVLNPLYDSTLEYTKRATRPEWGVVGLVGKVILWKDDPKAATWIKIKDINDELEEWLLK